MENKNFEEKIKELEELEKNLKKFEDTVRYEYEYNSKIKTKFESKEELDKVYESFINGDLKKFEDLKKEREKLQYTLKDLKDKNEEEKNKVESLFEFIKNWENNIEIILKRYKNILRDNEINFTLEEIKQFEKQKEQINNILEKYDDYNKKILEMMGIFLSIFSVIGLGVSSVLNLENNHIATWLMMCGTILITMTGLFSLINKKFEMKISVIILGLVLFCVGGYIRWKFPDDIEELVKKEKFEQFEKRVQNNENELLDKNLDYRNQIKDLKEEIKKIQSKVEKLEKRNS
jgi:hypothetical protein